MNSILLQLSQLLMEFKRSHIQRKIVYKLFSKNLTKISNSNWQCEFNWMNGMDLDLPHLKTWHSMVMAHLLHWALATIQAFLLFHHALSTRLAIGLTFWWHPSSSLGTDLCPNNPPSKKHYCTCLVSSPHFLTSVCKSSSSTPFLSQSSAGRVAPQNRRF